MSSSFQIVTALLSAYLIGSIPSAYILGRLTKGIDIRQYGSGNVGATNASRVLGPGIGRLCLVLDIVKGAVPVYLAARWLAPELASRAWVVAGCGLATILGHIYTIFLGFRGGKGVATTLGVFLPIEPYAIIAAALVGWTLNKTTRLVALGSLTIAVLIPILISLLARVGPTAKPAFPWPNVALGAITAGMIFWSHRGNIARLIEGTERRMGDAVGTAEEEARGHKG